MIAHLRQLNALAEERLLPKRPWTLDKIRQTTLTTLIRQIVAFRIEITRIEGKRKLNQNRSAADRAGSSGPRRVRPLRDQEIAEAMRGL